jgi:hypothetical protein
MNLTDYHAKSYLGHSGELLLSLFTVESLDRAEDYLLFAAITENGNVLEEDTARRLLSLPATSIEKSPFASPFEKGGSAKRRGDFSTASAPCKI